MLLYHGSNLTVSKPILISSKRLLDFGAGFYTTSSFEQAKKWALRTAYNRGTGDAVVSIYRIDQKQLNDLEKLIFPTANREWLRFIAANRKDEYISKKYDLIIGPVANDQVIRTVNDYLSGYFSEDIAIQLLLPQKLKDQYAFKTEKALELLEFTESKTV